MPPLGRDSSIAAPSPFLGDLNADQSIDILDVTLLRRYLAGLPVPCSSQSPNPTSDDG